MDYGLPGSSVRGIFQARVLEWGVIAFSHLILDPANSVASAEPRFISLFCYFLNNSTVSAILRGG